MRSKEFIQENSQTELVRKCCNLWDDGLSVDEITNYLQIDDSIVTNILDKWAPKLCNREKFDDFEDYAKHKLTTDPSLSDTGEDWISAQGKELDIL